MATMIELSLAAHERASKYGQTVPAAREDLRSYAMTWVRGVPVFDETRMRDDQSDDLMAFLERLAGRVRATRVSEKVQDWMEAYGGRGVRQADVQEAVGATKPAILKALRALVASGKVEVREEKNPRGGNASPRKRYYWVGRRTDTASRSEVFDDPGQDRGFMFGDAAVDATIGVIHHGTACGALQGCRCGRCRSALEDGYFGQMVSEARQAGGSGFAEGVELTTLRRKAWEYQEARRNG